MLAEISTGLSSLKAAMDIAKGLNAANTQASVNDVKIQLQQLILDAHLALMASNDAQSARDGEITELKQKIVSFENWATEKQRYHLQAIDRGVFAYMMKPGMEHGEPAHWLCTNCFDNGHRKSFLQYQGQETTKSGGRGMLTTYSCGACKSSLKVYYARKPSEPYQEA